MATKTGRIVKSPAVESDVRLLLATFAGIEPDGRTISHDQLEAVLKMSRRQGRYRTVVNRWRKAVRATRGIVLDGISGEGRGFVALTGDDAVRIHAVRERRSGDRKYHRALSSAVAPTDEQIANPTVRVFRARFVAGLESIVRAARQMKRELMGPPKPTPQLPRAKEDKQKIEA